MILWINCFNSDNKNTIFRDNQIKLNVKVPLKVRSVYNIVVIDQ